MASAVKQRRAYDPYRNMSYAYDGSAARVLDGGEALRPRPQVRPRQQELSRPTVAVMAVLVLMSYVKLSSISRQVVQLDGEMTRLQSEEAILRARYELAYDLGAIETAVTADGSMGKPQAGQMVIFLSPGRIQSGRGPKEKGVAGLIQGGRKKTFLRPSATKGER